MAESEVAVGGMRFALDLSLPLYEQVLDQIRGSLARGELSLGERMPSVRDLAQALHINPNTVMRAYQELDRDGLTESRRGQGTFLTNDARAVAEVRRDLALGAVEEFLGRMSALGYGWDEVSRLLAEGRGEHK